MKLTNVPPQTDDSNNLLMNDVIGLSMNADTVALIACQTGLGRTIPGEGIMGLGRAFQHAGAKSVLMSLWNVNSAVTMKIARRFFQLREKGNTNMEALQIARQEVREMEGGDHPYYWAPFILVGEVDPVKVRHKATSDQKAELNRSHATSEKKSSVPWSVTSGKKPFSSVSPKRTAQRYPEKNLALLEAAKAGNLARVKELLSQGAHVNCSDGEFWATPLHWASYEGHDKVVSLLLKKGARVNAINKDGRTPLILAAAFGRYNVVRILLRHRCNKSAKDDEGKSALEWAKERDYKKVVRLLQDRQPRKGSARSICVPPLHWTQGLLRQNPVVAR